MLWRAMHLPDLKKQAYISPNGNVKFSHVSLATAAKGSWQCSGVHLTSLKDEESSRRLRVLLVSATPISTVKGWP